MRYTRGVFRHLLLLRQVIETSNVAYEARDQAQNEINLLKVRPPAGCNATTRATRIR